MIPNYNVMGVAKAALEACVRYLAHDLGPSNIRVNAISAGPVKTRRLAAVKDLSKMLDGVAANAPLRRNTDPAEVADTAVFLASDLGRGVTGNVIYVDAGFQIMGLPASAQAWVDEPASENLKSLNMIKVEGLSKRYARNVAVDNVSFEVQKGQIVGFLGPNGAGKTTTMRILTCFLPPTSGTANVAGFDVLQQPMEVKRRIGYLPETPPLYPDMEVAEYLEFVGRLKGIPNGRTGAPGHRGQRAVRCRRCPQ